MKNWIWATLMMVATFAAAHFWHEYKMREALKPCLSGQQTVCKVGTATVTVERRNGE